MIVEILSVDLVPPDFTSDMNLNVKLVSFLSLCTWFYFFFYQPYSFYYFTYTLDCGYIHCHETFDCAHAASNVNRFFYVFSQFSHGRQFNGSSSILDAV